MGQIISARASTRSPVPAHSERFERNWAMESAVVTTTTTIGERPIRVIIPRTTVERAEPLAFPYVFDSKFEEPQACTPVRLSFDPDESWAMLRNACTFVDAVVLLLAVFASADAVLFSRSEQLAAAEFKQYAYCFAASLESVKVLAGFLLHRPPCDSELSPPCDSALKTRREARREAAAARKAATEAAARRALRG